MAYPGRLWVCLLTTLYLMAMVMPMDSDRARTKTNHTLSITMEPYATFSTGILVYVPLGETYTRSGHATGVCVGLKTSYSSHTDL